GADRRSLLGESTNAFAAKASVSELRALMRDKSSLTGRWTPSVENAPVTRHSSKNAEAGEETLKQLQSQYGSLFPHLFKSITAANGAEFANLSKHDIEVYYAHPSSAW
ncbi:MAG: transposase, family, partial [Eubacteriales bacterium]|nr:transposase, family [Eubacteriales bacterium]